MEWINIKDQPIPNGKDKLSGYSLPAVSFLYGHGFLVKGFTGEWSFTVDHKYYKNLASVTHWMPLPEAPKEK